MNAWTTLIGTLAVDRKPIPVPREKAKRPSRAMTTMTRKEICTYAAQFMLAKRHERRERTIVKVFNALQSPLTAADVREKTKITKTYSREILLGLIDLGLVTRTKGAGNHFYYERV